MSVVDGKFVVEEEDWLPLLSPHTGDIIWARREAYDRNLHEDGWVTASDHVRDLHTALWQIQAQLKEEIEKYSYIDEPGDEHLIYEERMKVRQARKSPPPVDEDKSKKKKGKKK